MSLHASFISFFKAHQATMPVGIGSSSAMPEGCYPARVSGLPGFCFLRLASSNAALVLFRLHSAFTWFRPQFFCSMVRLFRLALQSSNTKTALSSPPSPNPAVERDWPNSGFFAACAKLLIPGSGYVPWSASPHFYVMHDYLGGASVLTVSHRAA